MIMTLTNPAIHGNNNLFPATADSTPCTSTNTSETSIASTHSNNNINNSSKDRHNNKYGSVDDLQMYALGLQNQCLASHLVDAKRDWDALQKSYRANTHARFVYQTTLARIVAHVQDFSSDVSLVQDVLRWDAECEHLELPEYETVRPAGADDEDDDTAADDGSKHYCSHGQKTDGRRSHRNSRIHNGPIIIDWNDVEPPGSEFVVTRSLHAESISHHDSLGVQNDSLGSEIEKWKASMARIRLCNRNEVTELLKHQRTLSKVVERVRASEFRFKTNVVQWYEQCQEEADRCGSFSERNAEKYIGGTVKTAAAKPGGHDADIATATSSMGDDREEGGVDAAIKMRQEECDDHQDTTELTLASTVKESYPVEVVPIAAARDTASKPSSSSSARHRNLSRRTHRANDCGCILM